MGTIPTPPTLVAGENPTAAKLNLQRDAVNFWARTPRCSAYPSAVQSIPNNVYTAIGLDQEVYDIVQAGDSPSHDAVTNNTRLIARTAGIYEVSGQVQIASNATGTRAAQIRVNAAGNPAAGTLIVLQQSPPLTGASTSITLAPVEVSLAAGDYVELFGLQSSGGALNTVPGLGVTFLRMKLTGSP